MSAVRRVWSRRRLWLLVADNHQNG